MNKYRRKTLAQVVESLQAIKKRIETLQLDETAIPLNELRLLVKELQDAHSTVEHEEQEEEGAYESQSERFPDSERVQSMETAIAALSNASSEIESAINHLNEAIEA